MRSQVWVCQESLTVALDAAQPIRIKDHTFKKKCLKISLIILDLKFLILKWEGLDKYDYIQDIFAFFFFCNNVIISGIKQ